MFDSQVQEMVETADLGLVMGTSLKVNPFKKWVDCVGIPMVSCGETWRDVERSGEVEKWRSGPVYVAVIRACQIEYTF